MYIHVTETVTTANVGVVVGEEGWVTVVVFVTRTLA